MQTNKTRRKRSSRPKQPAAPVARNAGMRAVETGFRWLNHLAKVRASDGSTAAGDELDRLIREHEYDVSASSVGGTGVVQMLDLAFDRDSATQAGRSGGGKGAGKLARERAKVDYDRIRAKATLLLASDHEVRSISGIIGQQTGFGRPKILRALKSHPSGHWKKSNAS